MPFPWAILPMRTLGNCRETKQPKTALSFHAVQPPLFPFLFPLDALAVNESAGIQTAGPARSWKEQSASRFPPVAERGEHYERSEAALDRGPKDVSSFGCG